MKELTPAILSKNTLLASIIPTFIDKLLRKGTTVLPNTIYAECLHLNFQFLRTKIPTVNNNHFPQWCVLCQCLHDIYVILCLNNKSC